MGPSEREEEHFARIEFENKKKLEEEKHRRLAAEEKKKRKELHFMMCPKCGMQESIFSHGLGAHAIWVGLLMSGIVLFVQAWSIKTEHAHWQTMVFTVLCLTQLGHVLAIRSEKESLFTIGIFSNNISLVRSRLRSRSRWSRSMCLC